MSAIAYPPTSLTKGQISAIVVALCGNIVSTPEALLESVRAQIPDISLTAFIAQLQIMARKGLLQYGRPKGCGCASSGNVCLPVVTQLNKDATFVNYTWCKPFLPLCADFVLDPECCKVQESESGPGTGGY